MVYGLCTTMLGQGKCKNYIIDDGDSDVHLPPRIKRKMSVSGKIPMSVSSAGLSGLVYGQVVLAICPESTSFYNNCQ